MKKMIKYTLPLTIATAAIIPFASISCASKEEVRDGDGTLFSVNLTSLSQIANYDFEQNADVIPAHNFHGTQIEGFFAFDDISSYSKMLSSKNIVNGIIHSAVQRLSDYSPTQTTLQAGAKKDSKGGWAVTIEFTMLVGANNVTGSRTLVNPDVGGIAYWAGFNTDVEVFAIDVGERESTGNDVWVASSTNMGQNVGYDGYGTSYKFGIDFSPYDFANITFSL